MKRDVVSWCKCGHTFEATESDKVYVYRGNVWNEAGFVEPIVLTFYKCPVCYKHFVNKTDMIKAETYNLDLFVFEQCEHLDKNNY